MAIASPRGSIFPRQVVRAALALLVGLLPALAINPAAAQKKEEFHTAAQFAILVDFESGTVLFERAADQPTAPSSLAKLMTAEVVFNEIAQGRVKLTDEFIVSEDAWRRGGAPSHTSSMFAPIHSRVPVKDLLMGVIAQSANDASIALAQGIAGNETAFAIMMNKRARELGLTNSNFTNSTGLPDRGMRVTVRDLAKLARHTIRTYPDLYRYYGEREFTWNKIRQQNRNPLLAMNIGADGLKTGFTRDGGYGLAGSAVQNGQRLIVVVNGLKGEKERAEEAKRLLEWGFRGFEARLLFRAGQTIGEARLYGGEARYVPLSGPGAVNLMVPRDSNDRIVARIVYRGPVLAPVAKGQPIATLKVYRGDQVALEVPLAAAESVGRGGLTRRALDAVGELVISVIRSGTSRL